MTKHRKDAPKRLRRPLKPGDVAVIPAAIAAVLTGFAAILTAFEVKPSHPPVAPWNS